MAKKKKSNTGFRNGELFCFNCGASYNMSLPQPLTMVTALMKQFVKDHRDCKKTWEEPKPNPDLSNSNIAIQKNAKWWWDFGERGMSSEFVYSALLDRSANLPHRAYHPYDPDDFRRCYALLECVPQWKGELHRLKIYSEVWSKLVDNWDTLSRMLEETLKTKDKSDEEMFKFMKSLGC